LPLHLRFPPIAMLSTEEIAQHVPGRPPHSPGNAQPVGFALAPEHSHHVPVDNLKRRANISHGLFHRMPDPTATSCRCILPEWDRRLGPPWLTPRPTEGQFS